MDLSIMLSAICQDKKHSWCRGWFKEMLKSGMTGTEGQDLESFGSKLEYTCPCHIRHERY